MASVSSSNKRPNFNPSAELKSKLLRPALTSHYAVYINSEVVQTKTSGPNGGTKAASFFANRQADIDGEILTLSCSEASLPGSSFATHEANNDFTGVTERHVYRRQYDDRIDFTFYVDHDLRIIKFFETWMSWIVGEDQFQNQSNPNFSYRVKFPDEYRTDIYIQKFEKDFTNATEYTFIGAYPTSITSMPVSYDSSQLLKCTVSMSYIRYFMNNTITLTPNLNKAEVVGGERTSPTDFEFQLTPVPGQFTVPAGQGGARDLLPPGIGGFGVSNPVQQR